MPIIEGSDRTVQDTQRHNRRIVKEAKKAAPPAPPVEPPLPPEPPKVPELDISGVVLDTGETYAQWLSRRFDNVQGKAPQFGVQFALDLATMPITDQEVDKSADAAARAAFIYGPGNMMRGQMFSPDERTNLKAKVELQAVLRNRMLDDIEEQYPKARGQAVKAVTDRFAGREITPALIDEVDIDETDLEAMAFPGLDDTELDALKAFYPDLYERAIASVKTKEGLVNAEILRIGRNVTKAKSFFDEVFTPEESAVLEKKATASFGEQLAEGLPQVVGLLAETVEESYRQTSRAAAAGVEILRFGDPVRRWRDVAAFGPGRSFAFDAGLQPGSVPFRVVSSGVDFGFRIFADPVNVLGEVSAGAKMAERLLVTGAKQVPARGLRGQVAKFLAARSPEELMQSGRAQRTISRMWKDVSRLKNYEGRTWALADRYDIPVYWADEIANARSIDELESIVTDAMYGRVSQKTLTETQSQLTYAERTITDVQSKVKAGSTLDEAVSDTFGLTERLSLEEAEATLGGLKKLRRESRDILQAPDAGVIIDRLPDPGVIKRLRTRLGRSELKDPHGRMLRFMDDEDNWVRNAFDFIGEKAKFFRRPTGRVPRGHLSLKLEDRSEAAKTLAEVGKLYGLPKKTVDELVTKFSSATSHEEAYIRYKQLLTKAAQEGDLPKDAVRNLTGFAPAITTYGTDGGKVIGDWAKGVDIDGFETPFNQPLFVHQLAEGLPLPPLGEVIRARSWMGRFQRTLEKAGKTGGKINSAIDYSRALTRGATSVWKVLVLARGGWTLRVIPEEQLRLMSVAAWSLDESPLKLFARHSIDDIPPGAMAEMGGIMSRRSTRSLVVPKSDKEYYHHLMNNLIKLHSDPVVRRLLTYGDDDTVQWLLRGRGREHLDEYAPILQDVLGVEDIGEDQVRSWVTKMNQAIDGVAGRSQEVRKLIAEGKLSETMKFRRARGQKMKVTDDLRAWLRSDAIRKDLPAVTVGQEMYELYGGSEIANRAASAIMEALGSYPTNRLSRAPAYRFFESRERRRLLGLGVSEETAKESAKRYAIRQVGDLLYDLNERSATDVLVRNMFPFFPAWKEVLQRWTVTIPNEMGAGLGHAVLARRLQVLWEAMKGSGLARQNAEGEFEIRSGGYDALFSRVLGIEGLKTAIDPRSFNLLGSWPGPGPVPTVAMALAIKDEEKLGAIGEALWPYGLSPEVGPSGLSRLLRGLGLKPFWDIFDTDYRDTIDANATIDVLRANVAGFQALLDKQNAIIGGDDVTDEQVQQMRKEYRELWEDAKSRGYRVTIGRGILGLIVPAQPRLIWPGQEEANQIRAVMEKLDENTGQALFKDWLAENPIRERFFIGKTERIDGQITKDLDLEKYRKEVAEGLRVSLGEKYAEYATGDINYSMIRQRKYETVAELGTSFNDILRNGGWEYVQASIRAFEERENLKYLNPTWADIWKEAIKRGRRAEGLPVPTADEERAEETARNMTQFSRATDVFDVTDRSDVRMYAQSLREFYNLEDYYGRDMFGTTLERQEAEYYNATDDYWKQVGKIYNRFVTGKTAAQREEGFARLRELRLGYQPPVIDGVEYPHPEHAAHLRRSPAEKNLTKMKWAQGRVAWLAPWQREELGMKGDPEAIISFYNEAQRLDRIAGAIDDRRVGDIVDAIKAQRAKAFGVEKEWRFATLPTYKRVEKLGLIPNEVKDSWERVSQMAGNVRTTLEALGVDRNSIGSKTGKPIYRGFVSWLEGKRRQDPDLDHFLTELQNSTFLEGKARDEPLRWDKAYYPYLFFKEE